MAYVTSNTAFSASSNAMSDSDGSSKRESNSDKRGSDGAKRGSDSASDSASKRDFDGTSDSSATAASISKIEGKQEKSAFRTMVLLWEHTCCLRSWNNQTLYGFTSEGEWRGSSTTRDLRRLWDDNEVYHGTILHQTTTIDFHGNVNTGNTARAVGVLQLHMYKGQERKLAACVRLSCDTYAGLTLRKIRDAFIVSQETGQVVDLSLAATSAVSGMVEGKLEVQGGNHSEVFLQSAPLALLHKGGSRGRLRCIEYHGTLGTTAINYPGESKLSLAGVSEDDAERWRGGQELWTKLARAYELEGENNAQLRDVVSKAPTHIQKQLGGCWQVDASDRGLRVHCNRAEEFQLHRNVNLNQGLLTG